MTSSLFCLCLAIQVNQAPPEVLTNPPKPVPAQTVPIRAMTLQEFACSFKPAPGHYQVWLINPVTCCPELVCFTLPCGCPRVEVSKRELEFDYGRTEVRIRFRLFGRLAVIYE
jgi:hypothetical protein